MRLQHKNTGRLFTFIKSFTPQFTNVEYTELLNEKTGKSECYRTAGIIAYFEIIEN